jgi:hypothetical protein
MVAAFVTSSVSDRSVVGGGCKEEDVSSYFVRERITGGENPSISYLRTAANFAST